MTSTAAPRTSQPQLSRPRLVARRLVAAGIDLLLLTSILARLGDIVLGGAGEWLGRLLGVAAAIAAQGLVGASFGMAIVGLVVVRAAGDGSPPGLRPAALRHAWVLAPPLAAVPTLLFMSDLNEVLVVAASVVGSLLALAGLALPPLLLGTVIADDDARGLHDRWSGTAVVPTPAPGNSVATIGILLLLWGVLTGASWWLGEPDRIDSDQLGGGGLETATCDVRYDPYVGEREERTVELARGMQQAEVRLGPHVVRFDDEPFPSTRSRLPVDEPFDEPVDRTDDEGLFYEVRAQAARGMSSSGGGNGDTFRREIEVGGGLTGELTMTCQGERHGEHPAVVTPVPESRPTG